MRSCVIAQEALSRGFNCVIVGQFDGLNWLKEYIREIGIDHYPGNPEDFPSNSKTDVLILDSYTMSTDSIFNVKSNWLYFVSIVDEVTPSYNADLLINPSFSKLLRADSQIPILWGSDYVLTRKAISKVPNKEVPGTTLKVIISAGGSDPFAFSETIACVLDEITVDFEVHFFVDREIYSRNNKKFVSHRVGRSLDSESTNADLVLSTASTSSLEFIAREIPIGVVCVTENQQANYRILTSMGLASDIGFIDAQGKWVLNKIEICDLLTDKSKRDSYRNFAKGLIDLKGAERVVTQILCRIQTRDTSR
jgi:spore coat polysaccharide biosynthesis predicted glycosyltransferase SpsG